MTSHNEIRITVKCRNGKEYTGNHTQLCNKFGVNRLTFSSRIKAGWAPEEALGIRKRKIVRMNKRMASKMKRFFLYRLKLTEINSDEYHRTIDGSIVRSGYAGRTTTFI